MFEIVGLFVCIYFTLFQEKSDLHLGRLLAYSVLLRSNYLDEEPKEIKEIVADAIFKIALTKPHLHHPAFLNLVHLVNKVSRFHKVMDLLSLCPSSYYYNLVKETRGSFEMRGEPLLNAVLPGSSSTSLPEVSLLSVAQNDPKLKAKLPRWIFPSKERACTSPSCPHRCESDYFQL